MITAVVYAGGYFARLIAGKLHLALTRVPPKRVLYTAGREDLSAESRFSWLLGFKFL